MIPPSGRRLRRLGEPDLRPDFRQRLHQMLDIGVGMVRRRSNAQPRGTVGWT